MMNRRSFLLMPVLATTEYSHKDVKEDMPQGLLTASQVSYMMSYPILHREGDFVVQYYRLSVSREMVLRMIASDSTGRYITADFTVGDLDSYHAAKRKVTELIERT